MYRMLKKDLRTLPYKMVHCYDLTHAYKATIWGKNPLIPCQIAEGSLPNSEFTDKKLDIEKTLNHQNDRLCNVSWLCYKMQSLEILCVRDSY